MRIRFLSHILIILACSLLIPYITHAAQTKKPLKYVVLILDPGHGDRAAGGVNADPGAHAPTPYGEAWECVFTWDTTLRVKRLAEGKGAKVFLTLRDRSGDYRPKDWGPQQFPTVLGGGGKPGQEIFSYKELVDIPEPSNDREALSSRAATANRIYKEYKKKYDVYFFSLHFDSTSPQYAGISFYYARDPKRTGFEQALTNEICDCRRQRVNLNTGNQFNIHRAKNYNILAESDNPDSYLIELGNIQSRDKQGKNVDLWRMRDPKTRERYARMLVQCLMRYVEKKDQ